MVENPTRLASVAGITIEPVVSLPSPTVPNHAAIAEPVPELEPPGDFAALYGLITAPASVLPPAARRRTSPTD